MNTLLGKHWHHIPSQEVLDLLDTNAQQGLDTFEVKHRQERFGPNALTARKATSPLVRFLLQFKNPLVIILLVASGITAVLKDVTDALVAETVAAEKVHSIQVAVLGTYVELAINDESVVLTHFEYTILEYLMRNSGQVVSKQQLMDQLYDDGEGDPNTLEVLVSRLRKKLDPEGELQPISTIRRQGYIFNLSCQ